MEQSDNLQKFESVSSNEPLSKNQLKKLKRQAERQATKKQWRASKRQKLKEKKLKQSACGDELQQNTEKPLLLSPNNNTEKDEVIIPKDSQPHINILFDFSYETLMSEKQKTSLYSQICRCYGTNKRSTNTSVDIYLSPLEESTYEALKKFSIEQWKGIHGSKTSWKTNQEEFPKDKLTYLTPDSPNVLSELQPEHYYIIGAFVDKNTHKNLCAQDASNLGLSTARLPIQEHLKLNSCHVLTVNQVFEVILKYLETNSWKKALEFVVPLRKRQDHQHAQFEKSV